MIWTTKKEKTEHEGGKSQRITLLPNLFIPGHITSCNKVSECQGELISSATVGNQTKVGQWEMWKASP